MISAGPVGAATAATTHTVGADFWDELADNAVRGAFVDSVTAPGHALDAAFGGYQVMNGEVSIGADIVVPQVSCPDRPAGAGSRIDMKDEAVVAAAVEVHNGPVDGGAGVIAGCDYDGFGGPGLEKYFPVLFMADRRYTVVGEPVAAGDVLRAVFLADSSAGVATSSLENLSRGWTETSAPYRYVPGGYAEIGDRRIRHDPYPGFRQFISLPRFSGNSFERVVVDGAMLSAATGDKVDMVLPVSGDPQLVPSDVTRAGFHLVRRI